MLTLRMPCPHRKFAVRRVQLPGCAGAGAAHHSYATDHPPTNPGDLGLRIHRRVCNRRAASATDPDIDGYTVNACARSSTVSFEPTANATG